MGTLMPCTPFFLLAKIFNKRKHKMIDRKQLRKEMGRDAQDFATVLEILNALVLRAGASDFRISIDDRALVAKLGELNDSIGLLKSSVDQVNSTLGKVNSSVQLVNSSVGKTEAAVNNNRTEVTKVAAAVAKVEAAVDQINITPSQ